MASFSVPCPKTTTSFAAHQSNPTKRGTQHFQQLGSVSFWPDSKPLSGLQQGTSRNQSSAFKLSAQLTDVSIEKSSNCAPVPKLKPDETTKTSSSQDNVPDTESITAFMNKVTDLVKLVDSKDIVELQLKQMDCEILIRKKEALPQTTLSTPIMMQPPPQPINSHPLLPAPATPATHAGPVPLPPATAPSTPEKPKSTHPPLKCPMAGTFYRSPAPGTPPFVKVGDKVQKGQVVCIIEAMKLMNEIEADQSGTIVDILAEDAKSVSVDTPLLVIAP